MQRLVYSPKIQAFIQTDEGVIDISDFIVSGTIQRVVNEVSTAELVIRNPGKRFTQPGNPTFLPMDAITIFGSRHKGRPVQMFTGYLDTAPYLQLFPGTVTLRASCTLKRLLYTYWDAGLLHTIDFLSKYGWMANVSTGTIRNPKADKQKTNDGDGDKGEPLYTDGSVGNLMFGILKEIGQWDEEQILIEEFPKDADEIVKGLIEDISGNVTEAQNQFEQFLTDIIGEYGGGLPSGSDDGGTYGSPNGKLLIENLSADQQCYYKFCYGVAGGTGLSLAVVAAWTVLEGGPCYNPLNIGPGHNFGDVDGAIKNSVELIKSDTYTMIMNSVGKSDGDQIAAIVSSPWCPGCAGYESQIRSVYETRIKVTHNKGGKKDRPDGGVPGPGKQPQ